MSRSQITRTVAEPAPRYGDVAALARYSSLSEKTVRNLIDAGKLKVHRVGRRVLIAYEDMDKCIRGEDT